MPPLNGSNDFVGQTLVQDDPTLTEMQFICKTSKRDNDQFVRPFGNENFTSCKQTNCNFIFYATMSFLVIPLLFLLHSSVSACPHLSQDLSPWDDANTWEDGRVRGKTIICHFPNVITFLLTGADGQ